MHPRGHVHRDLKPQNSKFPFVNRLKNLVLYCSRQRLWKLTDFGFASDGMSQAKTRLYGRGTVGCRAPEILNTMKPCYNNRLDILAFGCILYEMLSGRHVF